MVEHAMPGRNRSPAKVPRFLGFVVLFLFAALLAAGCASTSDDGGGGCDEECVDSYTGYGIIETVRVLYNTHIYPNTGFGFNQTETCPLGGQVVITGDVTAPSATSLDLLYTMSACAYSDGDTFDLVFTGGIDEDGTISTTSTTLQYISDSLTYSGESYGEAVDETCDVSISRSDQGVTGTLCGRSFSY